MPPDKPHRPRLASLREEASQPHKDWAALSIPPPLPLPRPRTPFAQQAPSWPPDHGPRDTQNMGHEVVTGTLVMKMADRLGAAEVEIKTLREAQAGIGARVTLLEGANRESVVGDAREEGRSEVRAEVASERKAMRMWILGIVAVLITSAITGLVSWLVARWTK